MTLDEWMTLLVNVSYTYAYLLRQKDRRQKGLLSAIDTFCHGVLLGASSYSPAQTLCYRALSLNGRKVWDKLDKQGSGSLSKLFKCFSDVLKHIPWQTWSPMEQKWVGRRESNYVSRKKKRLEASLGTFVSFTFQQKVKQPFDPVILVYPLSHIDVKVYTCSQGALIFFLKLWRKSFVMPLNSQLKECFILICCLIFALASVQNLVKWK